MTLPVLSSDAGDPRPALLGRSRGELETLLEPLVDRSFRAEQVWEGLHTHGVEDFAAITNLPKDLRARLAETFRVGLPRLEERRVSADGTVKYLFRLADDAGIEAVDIPDGDRRTLCLSSQAGCALGCTFCVTGYWGAGRDLTAGEIVGQWRRIANHWQAAGVEPRRVNLVFMGMGEPLLNLPAVHGALEVLTEFIAWKRITVSTAGVVPGIREMAGWPRRPGLAISLHAAEDILREQIMPINRSWPLADLMAALEDYPLDQGEKITFEYILIHGLNDQPPHANALARLVSRVPAKVNLIPINPDPVLGEHMVPPPEPVVTAFRERLRAKGLIATLRRQRGDRVSAACGQLRAYAREPRGRLARG